MKERAERIQKALEPKPSTLVATDLKRIQRTWTAVWLFGIMIVLMIAAQVSLFVLVGNLSDDIETAKDQARADTFANRENGYRGRAVNCQVLIALSQPLPEGCMTPEVLRYYNPNAPATAGANSSSQVKIRGMLCKILRNSGDEPAGCTDPNVPLPPGF